MIKGACHCGAVTFEILDAPERLVSCNCSVCRRYNGLWVHSSEDIRISIEAPSGATIAYVRGDKTLAFHSCASCGCTTHWESLESDRVAVNARMAAPEDIKDIRVRRFDGADSWEFLD